jgi:hypothetical protein
MRQIVMKKWLDMSLPYERGIQNNLDRRMVLESVELLECLKEGKSEG